MTYLSLLRGINVGGKNIIRMADLKKIYAELDFENVTTYIQSGNVIFQTFEKSKSGINHLVTFSEMEKIINGKPKDFGEDIENYKYDVIFLIAPLKVKDAIKEIKIKDGVDKAWEGEKVIYASRLIKEFNKSYLSKIAESPIYKSTTIRNWNTTRKLFELMESFSKTESVE